MSIQTPKVIFAPRTDKLDKPQTVRFYERRKLTDYGDHVEWTDGRKVWKWRLPDQTDGPAEYPILKQIVFVPNTRTASFKVVLVKMLRVLFVAEDGSILTALTRNIAYLPVTLLDKILPAEAYSEIERRGVERVTEHYDTMQALYQAHPNRDSNQLSRAFAQHPVIWVWSILALIIIVVNLILLATGYYS